MLSGFSNCTSMAFFLRASTLAKRLPVYGPICLRHRQRLTEYAAAGHIQHMQKALMQMNLQLQHALSDITGETGMRIIRAIIEGERSASKLASYRNDRYKESEKRIEDALTGNYRPEHVFSLKQAVALYEFYQEQIKECDQEIEKALEALNADKKAPSEPSSRSPY